MAANGDICVNTLKKDWNPAKWSLGHILGVIRCLLIIPFPESSLNEEAGRLFMDDYEEYSRMAKLMTKIHAMPLKESETHQDENENTLSQECENSKPFREEQKEKLSGIKFEYKHTSNLDVSMEEEDKAKEPLQNYSNMVFSNNDTSSQGNFSREDNDRKTEAHSSKVSGASLFGGKAEGGLKKPKNKKKKVRRL